MHKLYNQDAIDFGPWETSNQNNLNTFYLQNILQQEDQYGINQEADSGNNEIKYKIELSKNDNPPEDNYRVLSKTLVKNYSEPNIHNKNTIVSSLQSSPKHFHQNMLLKNQNDSTKFTTYNNINNEKKRSNSLKRVENISDLNYNQLKVIKNNFHEENKFDVDNHQQTTQSNKSKIKIKLDTDNFERVPIMDLKYQDFEKLCKQNISGLPKKNGHYNSQTEYNQIEDLNNSQKQRQKNLSFKQKQEFNRQLIQYGHQALQTSNFLDSNIKEFQKNLKNKIQSVHSPVRESNQVKQSISDSINNALNQLKSQSSKTSYQDKTFKKSDELFQQQDWKQKIQQKKIVEQNASFFSANKESQKQSQQLLNEEKNNLILQNLDDKDSQNETKKSSVSLMQKQNSPSNNQKNCLLSLKKRPSINTNSQLKKLSFNIPACQDFKYQHVEQQIEGVNFNTPKHNSNQIENSIYYQYIQQKIINKGIKGQKVRNYFASQRNLLRSCPNHVELNSNQNEQTQNFKTNVKLYHESKKNKQISSYLNDSMVFQKSEINSPTQQIYSSSNSENMQKLNEKQNYLTLRRNELAQNRSEYSQINQQIHLLETSNKLCIDQNLNQSLIKVSLLKYNLNSIGETKQMEFNSYEYYQYEVALAKLIQLIIDRAKDIEAFKLTYINHVKFDSYQLFCTIDEDKQKYISCPDIMKLLRRNSFSIKQKDIEFLVDRYSSLKSLLFFKDFLKLVLPQGDEDMIDSVVKQSLGVVFDQGKKISPLIEQKLSELIEKEVKLFSDLQDLKISIAEKYSWSFKLAIQVFMKGNTGHITPKMIDDFMQVNGNGKYQYQDFKFLKNRFSQSEGILGLTQQEFGDMVYPYEFFYDPNDEKYDNYKSQQQEIEEEKQVLRKIQEKEEFDKKFKIIGDFIKDPEYYEQHENIIKFFEENQYRKLYQNLKNFDYYIDFAKEKIIYKPPKKEEEKEILDFYETIKQHQKELKRQALQEKKAKKKYKNPYLNEYKGLDDQEDQEDLFDTSNMPRFRDYQRQLKYETPSRPMTIKQFVKLIRADRNIFLYQKPEIKILKRMELFKTIKQDLKKQELRKQVIDNQIEEITVQDKKVAEIERKKLFSAFSEYNMLEDVNTQSPKQNSTYNTYLYKNSLQKSMSFGESLKIQTSDKKSDAKLIKPQSISPEKKDKSNIFFQSPILSSQSSQQESSKFIKKPSIIKDKSQKSVLQLEQIDENSFLQTKKNEPQIPSQNNDFQTKQFTPKEKNVNKQGSATVKKLQFYDQGELKSSLNNSQLSLEYLDKIKGVYPSQEEISLTKILDRLPTNPQIEEIKNQDNMETKKLTKKQTEQDIIKQAQKDIIQFNLINAIKRQKFMSKILDKSTFGDYPNKQIYKKYYQ
ncbi:hypothetical protein TTHERM_00411790 (macronuclear) [Tetrahymena thermophila SB210]|uniref:Uncharacterized protein n=1 Tax=Tetrahymena thermophila (strain SB210) TaxID=312017 RepID=I7LW25_TETTS|nr:hypothetical protein TTHERM_00411790 [Tetrahymena thermophila SB210]EAS00628.2 hypothetical protein TTHERM_00411790 [Tetrahymena thermophila SB210]|eukprot:XP_001020873.2 hypothetical protein TTHERM_00411790 [Tetrahymena thermophila SB210]